MTFEEWYETHLGAGTNEEFDVAKRAWNTALEEAANECEVLGQHSFGIEPDQCAKAIRTLKDLK